MIENATMDGGLVSMVIAEKSRKKVDEFRLVPKEKNEAEVMINKILGRVGVLFKSV